MALIVTRSWFTKRVRNSAKQRQLGVSLMGFLFLLIVVGGGAVLAMKVFPAVREYYAIGKAVEKVKGGATPAEIAKDFDRTAQIDDITTITGKDLAITKAAGGGNKISFAYDYKIPLFGPASILLEFQGSTK